MVSFPDVIFHSGDQWWSMEKKKIWKIFWIQGREDCQGFVSSQKNASREFESYIIYSCIFVNMDKCFRRGLYINPASRNYWLHSGIRGFDKRWRRHTRAACTRVRWAHPTRAHAHTFPRPSIVHTETKLAVIRGWLAAVDPCGGIYTRSMKRRK